MSWGKSDAQRAQEQAKRQQREHEQKLQRELRDIDLAHARQAIEKDRRRQEEEAVLAKARSLRRS